MANFAKIGLDNAVLDVQVIDNVSTMRPDGIECEQVGIAYMCKLSGHSTWVKTSFNTCGGKHTHGGVPLRKNYAVTGGVYDSVRDAFIPPRPYLGWVLNEDTCRWEAPTLAPTDGKRYAWNEETLNWVETTR